MTNNKSDTSWKVICFPWSVRFIF